jgi:hypothetical protein
MKNTAQYVAQRWTYGRTKHQKLGCILILESCMKKDRYARSHVMRYIT